MYLPTARRRVPRTTEYARRSARGVPHHGVELYASARGGCAAHAASARVGACARARPRRHLYMPTSRPLVSTMMFMPLACAARTSSTPSISAIVR